ncbi:MAG: hypothetical protein HN952_04060 [Candidatus Cloacimonetes bacterium]|nr:hypothetical protein [Candidatus Cloacimonadota bacterium]MBT6994112.1 hypothetical protein [Candidatus Cloacimonadota bacterium]MBT7470349.1 hypothetical protein [Candidatus Cloacimonadota bacterium]
MKIKSLDLSTDLNHDGYNINNQFGGRMKCITFLLIFQINFIFAFYDIRENVSLPDDFIVGADLSFLSEFEDNNGQYFQNCNADNGISILQNQGMDWVRLRIWHTPENGYLNLEKILESAQNIFNHDCQFLLDFHYSDTWADPGQQNIPEAWENLSVEVMADSIYEYTKTVVQKLKEQNTLPKIIQIGNEIDNGFLWPVGQFPNYDNFFYLLNHAILGVRDALDESDDVKIMIHNSQGGNNSTCVWYFNLLNEHNVDYEIIGLSYYPWWHGNIDNFQNNLIDLATRFNKDIIVVETAYPWTLQGIDEHNNSVWNENQILPDYPASKVGQAQFLFDISEIITNLPDNHGLGFFYWEPAWLAYPSMENCSNPWENQTLFDFAGNINTLEDTEPNPTLVHFSVDMSYLEPEEFNTNGIALRGNILPLIWQENNIMLDNDGDLIYTTDILFPLSELLNLQYKFIIASDNPIWESGEDRRIIINYSCNNQELPLAYWDRIYFEDVMGDVDDNGEIQTYDASLVLQNVIDLIDFNENQIFTADVDGNGQIQAYDASLILQYVVGIIDEFPID